MANKTDLPRNMGSYKRLVTKSPEAALKNRFIENNGILNDSPFSYVTRPGMKKWTTVGDGHIRKLFSEQGVFSDDLFIVSNTFLYRADAATETVTLIGELGSNPLGSISMAATAPVGDVPAYLYIAEGGVLWCYTEDAGARGQLQVGGAITDTETVEIDGVYYEFTSGSVDTGTPDGSAGNPWLVNNTGIISTTIAALYNAINGVGTAGTDYSTDLTAHATVKATSYTGSASSADLYVMHRTNGVAGNSASTTETMANGAWGAATLENGGEAALYQIDTPDDNGAISVAHINSYVIVICIQAEDAGTNGRFYWIEPGENEIDPLNFATAERSPDKLHQVVVFSNMFWLLGEKTTEPWITTGDAAAPMQRYSSILFDRGSWEGTAIQVKDSLIVADQDGAVFQIKGGLKRISTPQIEERIRKAIQLEKKLSFSTI